jgi:hypothetical protein
MEAFSENLTSSYFQSLEKFREPGPPYRLPARLEHSLKSDPYLVELEKEVQTLTEKGPSPKLDETKHRQNRYMRL